MEDYKKKYEDALERARQVHTTNVDENKKSTEYIFPELKVSEDERIREELIDAIHGLWDNDALPMPLSVKRKDEWISWLEKQVSPQMVADAYLRGCNDTEKKWLESKRYTKMDVDNAYLEGIANAKKELEKQGEQNPVDKVEPKFKVGDWIITKDKNVHKDYSVCKIVEIENNRYHLENGDYLDIDTLEQYDYRLWTIQDAKDGDVLVASDDSVFIYAGSTDRHAKFYVALTKCGTFNLEGGNWEDKNRVHPATKEQRELLFKKMAENGYAWDTEKKETKLLISNGGDFEPELSHQEVTKKSEQDGWTEEDEELLISYSNNVLDLWKKEYAEEFINWIKSLKQRLS